MKRILFAIGAAGIVILSGCSHKSGAPKAPDVKVADQRLEIKIERTDLYLSQLNVNNLDSAAADLQRRYGTFMDIYGSGILGIGLTSAPDFKDGLRAFLTYPVVQEAFSTTGKIFTPEAIATLESQLSEAFTRYKGTFPNHQIPKVYSYVAGFNQSIIVADSILAIGLDKYLGADYANYPSMGFPRYLTRKMNRAMIPSDALYAWVESEFPMQKENDQLLAHMIHQGKMMYTVQQLMPKISDTLLFGFSNEQMKWVKKNEAMMWDVLVSQKYLFNTENFVRTKFIGEAPFTNVFSTASPGKAAVWIGYRIVASYMRNSGSSLNDLMKNESYQQLLDKAKYRP